MKKIALSLLFTVAVAPALLADGAATFKSKCAMCHGADGAAQTGMGKSMKLKDLGSAEVQKLSDADLTKLISEGKGKMPAYASKLSAEEIKDVVGHIRSLKK